MYSTRIRGKVTTFGSSGLLYRSNKLMYDRVTYSLWSQLLGEPVIGPLADSGIKLQMFPVVLTTWGEWLEEHPDTTVRSRDTGYYRPSAYSDERDPDSVYYDYRSNSGTLYPVWDRSAALDTKDQVLGLSQNGVDKAYRIETLRNERVVNDRVGGTDLVIIASLASKATRVYARQGRSFRPPEETAGSVGRPVSVVDSDGVVWQVTDDSLENTADPSETLPRLPSHLTFWFGWYAFHPDTLVYGAESGD